MIFISRIRSIHTVISNIHDVNLPHYIDKLYLCNRLLMARIGLETDVGFPALEKTRLNPVSGSFMDKSNNCPISLLVDGVREIHYDQNIRSSCFPGFVPARGSAWNNQRTDLLTGIFW